MYLYYSFNYKLRKGTIKFSNMRSEIVFLCIFLVKIVFFFELKTYF